MTMGRPLTAASSMSGKSSANSNVAISRSPQSGSTHWTTLQPRGLERREVVRHEVDVVADEPALGLDGPVAGLSAEEH